MRPDPIELDPSGGVLVIDKPVGMTSHDVVAIVRRLSGIRRIGHCGTLDKPATGVLVLMLGRATRLASFVTEHDKRYSGTITFGAATDTDDATGEVIATATPAVISERVTPDSIGHALTAFIGELMQAPPRRSAVHLDGERLYRRDLKGEEIALPLRPVTVRSLSSTGFRSGFDSEGSRSIDIEVLCSKGTYIRSMARDLGERLGVPAHLSSLRRTKAGPFTLSDAVPLEELRASGDQTLISERLLSLNRAMPEWPILSLGAESLTDVLQGKKLDLVQVLTDSGYVGRLSEGDRFFIAGRDGRLYAAALSEGPHVRYLAVFSP